MEISKEELNQIPWVKRIPEAPRVIPLSSYYDATARDWYLFAPIEQGKLIRIQGGEVIRGTYFAQTAASPGLDVELPLGTLITQHLSFREATAAWDCLVNDIENFVSVLEKYRIIWAYSSEQPTHSPALVQTELEYLIVLSRSVYDLLQRISKLLGAKVILLDGSKKRAIQDLPESFAKVVLDGDRYRSAVEIGDKFGLPAPFVGFYSEASVAFKRLRDLRTSIVHHGRTPTLIFRSDSGFAVPTYAMPWANWKWEDAVLRGDRLGPLRQVFTSLIKETLDTASNYATAFSSCITLPEPIGVGIKVFLRHPYGYHLARLGEVEEAWEGEQGA